MLIFPILTELPRKRQLVKGKKKGWRGGVGGGGERFIEVRMTVKNR